MVFRRIHVEFNQCCRYKYFNNIVEQSHRSIKQKMVQVLGWKSEADALTTMAGQET